MYTLFLMCVQGGGGGGGVYYFVQPFSKYNFFPNNVGWDKPKLKENKIRDIIDVLSDVLNHKSIILQYLK